LQGYPNRGQRERAHQDLELEETREKRKGNKHVVSSESPELRNRSRRNWRRQEGRIAKKGGRNDLQEDERRTTLELSQFKEASQTVMVRAYSVLKKSASSRELEKEKKHCKARSFRPAS